MRKKSQDELGTLVTREMKVMLQDESLTKEQRFDILSCVMFDTPLKNTLMASFANSLKAGFEQINGTRYKAIDRIREFKRRSERIRRHGENMDKNELPLNSIPVHGNPFPSIPIHGELKAKAKQGNISPYKPPKGGKGKVPKAVEPEDIVEGQTGGGAADRLAQRRRGAEGDDVGTATLQELTNSLAGAIEQTEAFAHMRVNRRNLIRHLIPLVKKNCAVEDGDDDGGTSDEERKAFGKLWRSIFAGLTAWTEKWAADGWQYAPGKITKWLADEKWLEEPRKKTAPAEGSGCGDCGAEIA